MDWKADQVHGALFLLPSAQQQDALQLWQQLNGGRSPESYQRPSTSPFAASQAVGTVGKYNFTVVSNPGRIDLQIGPHLLITRDAPPQQISDIADACSKVVNATETLSRNLKFNRFGLIANLSIRCSSSSEMTSIMSEASDNTWFPDPPNDCVYQVNVRTEFKSAPEIEMNRVITLAASTLSLLDFQLVQSGILDPTTSQSIPLVNAKLDFNSAPGTSTLRSVSALMNDAQNEIMRFVKDGVKFLK